MGALKSKRCSKGHPLKGENLYLRKDGTRECRKCSRDRFSKWRKNKVALKRKATLRVKRTKPRRVSVDRNIGYRRWLKSQQCVACRNEFRHSEEMPVDRQARVIQAAHTINNGMGSKGPDSCCVPLCVNHHRMQHNIGWPAFEGHFGISKTREAINHFREYGKQNGDPA